MTVQQTGHVTLPKNIRNDNKKQPKEQYYFNNFIKGINLTSVNGEDYIYIGWGDDYLVDNTVLSYLNDVYSPDIWMTYGQFVPISGIYPAYCKPIPT